jgi:hypothetical protein
MFQASWPRVFLSAVRDRLLSQREVSSEDTLRLLPVRWQYVVLCIRQLHQDF